MARTPNTALTLPTESDLDEGRLQEAQDAATELSRLNAEQASRAITIAQQLGYQGSMTVGALEDEIRFYQRRTVEAILETGKRLLVLKELTPHGEFTARVELLGFAKTTAFRFMQAAAKTAKSSKLELLSSSVKNASAFLELVTHDDDVLDGLQEMDDFDRMSASQLRQAARELAADKAATEQLLEGKNRKIDELTRKGKKFNVDVDLPAEFAEASSKATEAVNTILTMLQRLEDLRNQAMNDMRPEDEHGQAVHLGQLQSLGMVMFGGYTAINEKLKRTETAFSDTLEKLLAD